MRWKSELLIPAVILIIIGVVVGFLIYGGEDIIGLDSDDTVTLISLLPAVFAIFIAAYAVRVSNGFMLGASVAGFGLSIAYAVYSLDSAEILIPELVMSASDIEILVIFVFLILAVVLAVRRK